MITVLTWLWSQPGGRTNYTGDHVAIWADMIRRNLMIPHRLVCVTDEALDLPSHIEVIPPPGDFVDVRIPSWPEHRPQCLRRLCMFRPDAAEIFGPRIVCTDLDLVVGASLDPLFETKDKFRICKGTAQARPYNGSMFILTAGARPQVYADFTPEAAAKAGRRFMGSDQAWIAHRLPGEATWDQEDGVFFYGMPRTSEAERRVMFFAGEWKPWMRWQDGWVWEHYRRDSRGRCLILGYAPKVWADLEAVQGSFDGLIVSPEAAEHLPGPFTAIAADDMEAARIAHMHGFEELIWCGRSEKEV